MNRTQLARGLVALGSFASIAVAATVYANAPSDQYLSFVQPDTVITDRKTKLAWERTSSSFATWALASGHCVNIATRDGLPWRLPTENELLTLVDEAPHQQYEDASLTQKAIDPSAFPATASALYATQTVIPVADAGTTRHVAVDFTTGIAASYDGLSTPQYARCVYPCVEDDAGACVP